MGRTLTVCLVLAVATFAAYAGVAEHEFLGFDDKEYVVENPHVRAGLSAEGVTWAFTHSYASNWHPLTWLSHMLDCQLFGLEPGPHHLVSVALHALAAVLLFLALLRLTEDFWPSAAVAALFALHPLRAESVAWVAERKDVLAGVFFGLTLLLYAGYARAPSAARYVALALALALGLMAKPMLVTVPVVLLLLDHWPLRRLGVESAPPARGVLLEKLPLLALAAGSAVATVVSQEAGGATSSLASIPLAARLANAPVALVQYLGDTLWPSGLAFFYPHPAIVEPDAAAWGATAFGALGLVLALTALAVAVRRRAPWVLVGWLWTLAMLAPVIGIVQVGVQARADRYTYLPLVGATVAVVWAVAALVRHRGQRSPAERFALAAGALALLAALGLATRRQAATWRDSVTLYERALAVTERNFTAHANLGQELLNAGDLAGAQEHLAAALDIRADLFIAQDNLGLVHARLGELTLAEARFREAVRLAPGYAPAHNNLAVTLERRGRAAEAIEHYLLALRADPPLPNAADSLARIRATSRDATLRDGSEALRWARYAVEVTGGFHPGYLETLAAAWAESGDFVRAVEEQRRALQMLPPARQAPARERLALYESGRPWRR